MEHILKFLKWITEVTGVAAFTNNTLMCSGMVIVESVLCLVLVYAGYNGWKIIMAGDDKVYSNCLDKVMYSGAIYYIIRFVDAYLYAKCI